MIRIPTWVMATDGLLHRDPVIRTTAADGRNAFLCFCDSEPPELVIESRGKDSLGAHREAVAILGAMGIKAKIIAGPILGVRCFGADASSGPYAKAHAFFLDISAPIPASLFANRGHTQPSGGGCAVHSFGKQWG